MERAREFPPQARNSPQAGTAPSQSANSRTPITVQKSLRGIVLVRYGYAEAPRQLLWEVIPRSPRPLGWWGNGVGLRLLPGQALPPPEKVWPTQVHGSFQKAHVPVPRMRPKRQPRFTPSRTHNPDLADALKRSLSRKTFPNRVLSFQTPVAPFDDPTRLAYLQPACAAEESARARVRTCAHAQHWGSVSLL